ncbi:ABC transporter permease subunit [Candidatus Sumerlaeota bacterium]|nr:ABC transporter permease subunit [Candidatus Sumerlaeota bacterium]
MFDFWPIYKREVRGFLHSFPTYIALGLLFLVAGAIYHDVMVIFVNESGAAATNPANEAPNITVSVIQQIFQLLSAMILFTIPILSMRLIASERSSGTFEVLVTCPIGDWSILLGKYFALLTIGAMMVVFSSIYPATTYYFGRSHGAIPEWPVVVACHLGLFMIFATYAAFGLMASSFTSSQVTASIITLIGLLIWNLIAEFPTGNPAVQRVINELSAARHTENFMGGFLTLRDIAFYALASFFCLFVASRMLEARRWKI